MGLAYGAISSIGQDTFFESVCHQFLIYSNLTNCVVQLYNQGVISSAVFAFRLASTGSELYLGGTDTTKYTGAITYTPVTQQAYWVRTLQPFPSSI